MFERSSQTLLLLRARTCSASENSWTAAEVDIGWSEITEAFVVTPVVVEVDQLGEACFELSRQVVTFDEHHRWSEIINFYRLISSVAECTADVLEHHSAPWPSLNDAAPLPAWVAKRDSVLPTRQEKPMSRDNVAVMTKTIDIEQISSCHK